MLQTSPSLKPIPTPCCEIIFAESGCTSEDDASPSIHPRLPQALAIRVLREVLSSVCSGTSRRGAGTDPALARPGFGDLAGRWGRGDGEGAGQDPAPFASPPLGVGAAQQKYRVGGKKKKRDKKKVSQFPGLLRVRETKPGRARHSQQRQPSHVRIEKRT